MTKISRIVAIAGTLGVMGIALVPIAGYAAVEDTGTTTVNVTVGGACGFDGGGTVTIPLNSTTTSGEQAATAFTIDCNNPAGWELSEQINSGSTVNLAGATGGGSITPWSTGAAVTGFADNTWGAKYAGTGTEAGAQAYHAVPANASPSIIAQATSVAVNAQVTATYGAKINASLPATTYSTVVLYTLSSK
jgi:hypothetical protein